MNTDEEKKLLRKLDFRILPLIIWLYFLSYLDRTNIGNVKKDLMEDLSLTEEQYSTAVSVFYIGYILFEVPSNILLKKTKPSFWIGTIVLAWGVASTCMFLVNNYATLITIRVFLGIAESGFFPGIVFYLTYWYPKKEQGLRVAIFYSASAFSGAIGGALAFGILRLDDLFGLEGWKILFLVEGFPSVISGILTWFLLPNYPQTSNWLTESEKALVIQRIKNEHDNSKVPIVGNSIWSTLINLKVWGFSLMLLTLVTPVYSISFYLPSIIEDLGFTSLESNILTTPIYLVTATSIIVNAYYSDKSADRSWHVVLPAFIGCFGFILLTLGTWFDITELSYASIFFANSGIACGIPITMAWLTNCLNDWKAIATASGIVVGVGNIGGILGPSLYGYLYLPPKDESEDGSYILGHLSMAIMSIICAIVSVILKKTSPPIQRTVTEADEKSPLLNSASYDTINK